MCFKNQLHFFYYSFTYEYFIHILILLILIFLMSWFLYLMELQKCFIYVRNKPFVYKPQVFSPSFFLFVFMVIFDL